MTTIEQILLNRVKFVGDGEWTLLGTPNDVITELTQAIEKDILELIGSDREHSKATSRPYKDGMTITTMDCESLDGYECTCGADIVNATKSELRLKLKEYRK
jgi:hypothetical protein